MNAIDDYCRLVAYQLQAGLQQQRAPLEAAAAMVARALMADGFLYVFGTGHSHLLAEEVFYRAGGLARAAAILDPALMLHQDAVASSQHERQTGYAREVLARYPLRVGDVLVIASNSGRNAVPIEMALLARERGLETIAITSLAHSRAFASRHPSGKHLSDVADLVLDNLAVAGDAALHLPGLTHPVGPTSTLLGVFLLNLVVLGAIENALAAGHIPEVYASSNADAPEWNEALIQRFRDRIRHLSSGNEHR
jgi:uncharacterized phosphosugar-binding protein